MNDDWKEWDVLTSLKLAHPPDFTWIHGDNHEAQMENRAAVLHDNWKQMQDVLEQDGAGYERLVTMKGRLQTHLEEVNGILPIWESRAKYSELVFRGYRRKVLDLAVEQVSEDGSRNADPSEVEASFQQMMDVPMGKAWEEETGLPDVAGPPSGGWYVMPVLTRFANEEPSPPTLKDLKIIYRPIEEDLKREGIDRDHLKIHDSRSFDGDTTWRTAIERIKDRWQTFAKQRSRYKRTQSFLQFRLNVLENVLYRFEAFGKMEMPNAEDSLKMLADGDNGYGVPVQYAEEIVQVYEDTVEENDETIPSRSELLNRVANRLDLRGETPKKTLENALGDLYPRATKPGRPTREEGMKLVNELVHNCRRYIEEKRIT